MVFKGGMIGHIGTGGRMGSYDVAIGDRLLGFEAHGHKQIAPDGLDQPLFLVSLNDGMGCSPVAGHGFNIIPREAGQINQAWIVFHWSGLCILILAQTDQYFNLFAA